MKPPSVAQGGLGKIQTDVTNLLALEKCVYPMGKNYPFVLSYRLTTNFSFELSILCKMLVVFSLRQMGSRRIDKEPPMQPRGHKNGQRDNFFVDFEDGNFRFYQKQGVCQYISECEDGNFSFLPACEFPCKEDVEKKSSNFISKIKRRIHKRRPSVQTEIEDRDRSMCEVIPLESDAMKDVSVSNNPDRLLKNWKHLASVSQISRDIYSGYMLEKRLHPTESLLERISTNGTDLTLRQFLSALESTGRNDIGKEIKKLFQQQQEQTTG